MILQLSSKERDMVVRALRMLAEDLQTISASVISPVLQREFARDLHEVNQISGRAAGLEESPSAEEFRAQIIRYLRSDQKIWAIKYVRTHKFLALKEAKDYVEQIQREEGI